MTIFNAARRADMCSCANAHVLAPVFFGIAGWLRCHGNGFGRKYRDGVGDEGHLVCRHSCMHVSIEVDKPEPAFITQTKLCVCVMYISLNS